MSEFEKVGAEIYIESTAFKGALEVPRRDGSYVFEVIVYPQNEVGRAFIDIPLISTNIIENQMARHNKQEAHTIDLEVLMSLLKLPRIDTKTCVEEVYVKPILIQGYNETEGGHVNIQTARIITQLKHGNIKARPNIQKARLIGHLLKQVQGYSLNIKPPCNSV